MKKIIVQVSFLMSCSTFSVAQQPAKDSTNNLVLPNGYKTSEYGSIPSYVKSGKGSETLILIPGVGFDASLFKDFMRDNSSQYTMYAITIPGYGNTKAPPMPVAGSSYGGQSWNNSVLEGVIKLINKKKINRPVIVGYFVQGTQLALQMAIKYPDKVGGVIVMGGPAKFIYIDKGKPTQYPLENTIAYIDKVTAPQWFGKISHTSFNDGNYLPEIYSLDTATASDLWKQSSNVPLPIMVRYLCEFFASDVTLAFEKIKCPVLVLRPAFNQQILDAPVNNYVKPQFIDAWTKADSANSLIKVKDIPRAATCIWKDNPVDVYSAIRTFTEALGTRH